MIEKIEIIGKVKNIDTLPWLVEVDWPSGDVPYLFLSEQCVIDEISLLPLLSHPWGSIELPYLVKSEERDISEYFVKHGTETPTRDSMGFYTCSEPKDNYQPNILYNPNAGGHVEYRTPFLLLYEDSIIPTK